MVDTTMGMRSHTSEHRHLNGFFIRLDGGECCYTVSICHFTSYSPFVLEGFIYSRVLIECHSNCPGGFASGMLHGQKRASSGPLRTARWFVIAANLHYLEIALQQVINAEMFFYH